MVQHGGSYLANSRTLVNIQLHKVATDFVLFKNHERIFGKFTAEINVIKAHSSILYELSAATVIPTINDRNSILPTHCYINSYGILYSFVVYRSITF